MANEGSTKPTYSELEAELLRVRGLLQRQWISVEERLPEIEDHCGARESGLVLARRDGGTPDVAYRFEGGWRSYWRSITIPQPTHWMPLVPSGAESADIGKLDSADKSLKELLRRGYHLFNVEGTDFAEPEEVGEKWMEEVEAELKLGSAETGGEKAGTEFSSDEQRKIAQTQACMDSVGEKWVHPERYSEYERNMGLLFAWEWDNGGSMRDCEFAEVIAAAVQRAATSPRPSQNQTVSSGVEDKTMATEIRRKTCVRCEGLGLIPGEHVQDDGGSCGACNGNGYVIAQDVPEKCYTKDLPDGFLGQRCGQCDSLFPHGNFKFCSECGEHLVYAMEGK